MHTPKNIIHLIIILVSLSVTLFLITPLSLGVTRDWKMEITGNTKTQIRYIRSLVEKCILDQAADVVQDVDLKRLQECLINSRLFSEVDVELDDGILRVHVKDRWSIIPIPFVSSGKDQDTTAGFHVYESNLLGYGKTLGIGSTYSESGASYSVMYHDRSLFWSDWSVGLAFSRSQDQIYHYMGEDKMDGMDESVRYYSLSGGYRFHPKFQASLRYRNLDRDYEVFEGYQRPEDYRSDYLELRFRWDDSNYRFYFQEGMSANLTMARQIGRSDDDENRETKTVEMDFGWQRPIIHDHIFQFRVQAGRIYHEDRRETLRVGGRSGFRGIQGQGAWTKQHIAGSLDYQIPLHRSSKGTWTVAPFVDAGRLILITSQDDQVDYYACGVGTYYFLQRIALPGLGLAMGHNSKYQDFFFQFTIGFSM
ncbi:MAG: BamA/TamA family outer membrane protein [Deltaproteobacteria bacterium]|nr:BamA/TamA family outer membrane protein [Deltaproteobacteria bacterium]